MKLHDKQDRSEFIFHHIKFHCWRVKTTKNKFSDLHDFKQIFPQELVWMLLGFPPAIPETCSEAVVISIRDAE